MGEALSSPLQVLQLLEDQLASELHLVGKSDVVRGLDIYDFSDLRHVILFY